MSSAFTRSAKLRSEIDLWVKDGLISEAQAQALHERYQLNQPAPWYQRSSFILRGLAALLVALGFFLFISQNWHHMGQPFRFATGIVPLLAAYGLGFWFLKKNDKDAAELSFFFASIAFGVNIALQAQIFHLGTYYPDGILWWLIGALPVAVYFRSNLHYVLLFALFIIWLSLQAQYEQFSWWAPALILALTYLALQGRNLVVLVLWVLSAYFFLAHVQSAFSENAGFLSLLAATTTLMIVGLPLLPKPLPEAFVKQFPLLGMWLLIGLAYYCSFPDAAQELSRNSISWLTWALVGVTAGLLIWKRNFEPELIWSLAFLVVVLLGSLLPINRVDLYVRQGQPDYYFVPVLANFLLVGHIAWRLVHGIRSLSKHHFMIGVGLLLLLAFSRYLDLTDNYLAGAALFVLSGLLLLLANHFWNKHYAA